jgi:hypothetical protein
VCVCVCLQLVVGAALKKTMLPTIEAKDFYKHERLNALKDDVVTVSPGAIQPDPPP